MYLYLLLGCLVGLMSYCRPYLDVSKVFCQPILLYDRFSERH